MSAPGRLHIAPAPDPRPPIVSADEAYGWRPSPYVQDALAIDFGEPHLPERAPVREHLPDPEPFVARMAQAFVEIMAGIRPAQQVVRWTTPGVYAVLSRRAFVAARRPATTHRRAVVRRVRVQEPAPGVVEACAVVVHHDRVRALALRLTGLDERWVVSELQVG
ncbi:MAG: Rv3235 family protein [Dermatophilaceae bacterium]